MDLTGLTFDDVLLRPKRGMLDSREDADITVPSLKLGIPIIAAPMPSVASPELLREIASLGGMGVVHRINRSWRDMLDDWTSSYRSAWVAVGVDDLMFDDLYTNGVRTFVLDVAHGHSEKAMSFVSDMKENYPDTFIIGGSVATYEGAEDLISVGVDALRVGVGPGSVCTTRQVTGFGVPQLQAIQECAEAVEDIAGWGTTPIIADGGIRNSGDIAKALAAGADAVMVGGLFARSIEAGADAHYGCASHRVNGHNAPEGIEIVITEKPEPLEDIVKRLTWGLRSAISYAGASNIKELQQYADFTKLTDAGRRESKLA